MIWLFIVLMHLIVEFFIHQKPICVNFIEYSKFVDMSSIGVQKYSCLIVEDDPAFSQILASLVDKIPFLDLIGVVHNSIDAALRIAKDRPHILFLDINISGLDGPEILEASDYKPHTIIISSHNESVMKEYDVTYDCYIQKPLKSAKEFIEAVKKVLY